VIDLVSEADAIHLPWAYLMGWPAFCAALGAGGTILYRWLFSLVMRRKIRPASET
jgi:hypothetical protein